MDQRESLPVIFRAERSGDFKGDVTAVFPTLVGTDAYDVTVYAHVGQHSTGSRGWYNGTRAAKPDEYVGLLRELKGIYEDPDDEPVSLVVVQRWTKYHDAARKAEMRRMDEAARAQA